MQLYLSRAVETFFKSLSVLQVQNISVSEHSVPFEKDKASLEGVVRWLSYEAFWRGSNNAFVVDQRNDEVFDHIEGH